MDSQYLSKSVIHPAIKYLVAVAIMAGLGFLTSLKGPVVLFIALAIPLVVGFFLLLFHDPKIGLYCSITLSFLIPLLNRFVYNLPYGFGVEIILLLVYIILFFKHFKNLDFRLAKNDIVMMMIVWMVYILAQLVNPEAHSLLAWAYAMRGMALLQLLVIPLTFVLLKNKRDLRQFLIFYFTLSVIGLIWGIKQQVLGLSDGETEYLYSSGAYKTHLLFGKLRVFSLYFDAGTFGAAMGQLCIIAAILFMGPFQKVHKNIFLTISLLAFYAMMISGTRGAIAIPATGAMIYVILIKNIKYIVVAASILMIGYVFLAHSDVGSSNYNISRLRTALDPEDASLNVRLRNRGRLTEYLKGKPFGGGVGSAGTWGQRFSPNTWLANFPPDGLYTRIRAETGIVGISIYLFVWLYIFGRAFLICWNFKNPLYKSFGTAFLGSFAGILVANYGNEVMTQYPNNFVTFMTVTFIFTLKRWEEQPDNSDPDSNLFET